MLWGSYEGPIYPMMEYQISGLKNTELENTR